MKAAIMLVILGVLMGLELTEAGLATTNVAGADFLQTLTSPEGKPCKCMNWRNCHGEINSDVPCHPSYAFVCCVIPKPEFNDEDADIIQVIHV